MDLIEAHSHNADSIKRFYRYMAEHTEHMDLYGRWVYGLHPTDDMIDAYIQGGYM